MSKSELERQTDRTVAASRKQTGAIRDELREQTAAIRDQTRAINQGFSQTVDALRTQTSVLRSVDFGVRAVASQLRGLREDIYAATQNREALEAKSKIERAEQLLTSDLPVDALRLLREAEVLNPADFAVWSMKVMYCRHAIENGVDCMTADEARQEGAAAIERVVKLYPVQQLGSERSLYVLQWLAGSAILLGSQPGFERATALFAQSVDAGGTELALSPPSMTMSSFLEDVGQRGHARDVAVANGRLLARVAASGDDAAMYALVPAWVELVGTYPDAVGPEVEVAIVAGARRALTMFVGSVDAAVGALVATPREMFRSTVEAWLMEVDGASRGPLGTVQAWRDALTLPDLTHGALLACRATLDDIVRTWDPAAWRGTIGTLAEPPHPVHTDWTMLLAGSFGLQFVLAGFFAVFADDPARDDPSPAFVKFLGFIMCSAIGAACLWYAGGQQLRYRMNRDKPLPSPSTIEFVQGIRDHLARWMAAAAR